MSELQLSFYRAMVSTDVAKIEESKKLGFQLVSGFARLEAF